MRPRRSASLPITSSSLNLSPSGPRSICKAQPPCSWLSDPPGSSKTPSSVTNCDTTILLTVSSVRRDSRIRRPDPGKLIGHTVSRTMGKLAVDITMSLDGFVAGPNPTLERPLGEGGEGLHEWALALESWRRRHGLPGGETNASTEVVEESLEATGAVVMGRRMFSGGEGPWEDDPNADAWWGDNPPFHVPVFVLTHHPRETMTKDGGTTFAFVTEGVEAAL